MTTEKKSYNRAKYFSVLDHIMHYLAGALHTDGGRLISEAYNVALDI